MSLHELIAAAAAFNNSPGTRRALDTMQTQFDRKCEQAKYTAKVSDNDAAKAPWKPFVASAEASSADIIEAIDRMSCKVVGSNFLYVSICATFTDGSDLVCHLEVLDNGGFLEIGGNLG